MRSALAIGLLVCSLGGVASGQGGRVGEPPGRGNALPPGPGRAKLEMQLRQQLARRARVELGLDQDQMLKLVDVERKFSQQQRALDVRENQTRRALRSALLEAPSADQDKRVGELHEQLMQVQRQRLDLVDAEQKDLSGFMTNVQRVRFQGLLENFRRQVLQDLARQAPPPLAGKGPPPR